MIVLQLGEIVRQVRCFVERNYYRYFNFLGENIILLLAHLSSAFVQSHYDIIIKEHKILS